MAEIELTTPQARRRTVLGGGTAGGPNDGTERRCGVAALAQIERSRRAERTV
jgi:hypothetical protein